MYQVPAKIWNEIAATGKLRNPSFKTLMAMQDQQILKALDEQAKVLESNGVPDAVIVAYQEIAPLLAENQAISDYINQTESLSLRAALPEVLSASEAVAIAARDRVLSSSEKAQLKTMFTRLEPST